MPASIAAACTDVYARFARFAGRPVAERAERAERGAAPTRSEGWQRRFAVDLVVADRKVVACDNILNL